MPADLSCPERADLERFVLGQTLSSEAGELEEHVAGCSHCAQTLDQLYAGVRRAGPGLVEDGDRGLVAGLIGKLKELRPMAAGEGLAPAEAADEIGRVGSYRVLAVLGTGGMGVVYLAEQQRPRRRVALKLSLAAGPGHRQARSRHEPEMIALLQHPNIVPVYEAGEHQGRPYFSMELMTGGSLAQKLAAAPLPAPAAAELVRTLARAVGFAHERGFIHRDLKPANVLLAEDGTPRVSDFGLAREMTAPDGRTESGAILGTPAYMAPEQALGAREAVGPAADVYALGAILYEALTGRPPFKAATVLQTLDLVRSQEPVPPGRLQPGVPRDLETICLKCLAKEPARRYGSAAALAEELGRFLAGEPIQARSVGRLERTWRWCRRNPRLALASALAVLSLMIAVAVLAVSVVRIGRARDQAEEALRQEEAARQEADANFQKACEVVNRSLERLRFNRLGAVPGASGFQESLVRDALSFYRGVAPGRRALPEVRMGTARAYRETGEVHGRRGQYPAARQAYATAIGLLEGLVADFPGKAGYRHELGITLMDAGFVQQQSGARAEAETRYRQALAQLEKVTGAPLARHERANVLHNLAGVVDDRGQHREAEQMYRQALTIRQELTARAPREPAYRHGLALTLYNLAVVVEALGRRKEALALCRQATDLHEKLRAELPGVPQYRQELAREQYTLGNLLKKSDPQQAHRLYQKALGLRQRLADDYPDRPLYRLELAHIYDSLGLILGARGQAKPASEAHRNAVKILERLLADDPGVPDYHHLLAGTLNNLAILADGEGNRQEVCRLLRRAIRHERTAVKANPSNEVYRRYLRFQCGNLTLTLLGLRDHAEAARVAAELASVVAPGGQEPYLAAEVLARCADLAEKAAPEKAPAYRDGAVRLLEQAVRNGYRGGAALEKAAAFARLRQRKDFQTLVNQLKRPR